MGEKLFDPAVTELDDSLTPKQIVEELEHITFKGKAESHLIRLDRPVRDFICNALRRDK
jgi:hypothetical protein